MRFIYQLSSAVAGLGVAALVLLTFAAVVARYVFGSPIAWTEEASGFLMIWIVMIGAIACEAGRHHLTIDLLENALKGALRRGFQIIVGLTSIGLLLFMAWQAWALALTTTFKKTQILGISWFWLDLAVVIGAGLSALVTLIALFRPEASVTTDQNAH